MAIVFGEPHFQEAVNEINKASEELVEPFIKILEQAKMKFDVRILEGSPGNKIPEVARIEKIDLIVMESRGVTDFTGLLLGSFYFEQDVSFLFPYINAVAKVILSQKTGDRVKPLFGKIGCSLSNPKASRLSITTKDDAVFKGVYWLLEGSVEAN